MYNLQDVLVHKLINPELMYSSGLLVLSMRRIILLVVRVRQDWKEAVVRRI